MNTIFNKEGLMCMIKVEPPDYASSDDNIDENETEDTSSTSMEDLLNTVKTEVEDSNSNSSGNLNDAEKPDVSERHQCPRCNKTYKHKSHVNRHIKSHCDSLTPALHCDHCSFFTKQKGSLKRHMERKHGPNASPKEELPRFLVVPIEGPPLKHQCLCCNKSYSHRFALDRHTAIECKKTGRTNVPVQEDVREPALPQKADPAPSSINEANGQLPSEQNQAPPMDETTSAAELLALPRPYRCMLCGKCYKSFPSLYRHTRNGCSLELRCEHCHFRTNSKRNFPKHFERKHPGIMGLPEEPLTRFQCPTCPRSYKHQCGLLQHVRFDCGQPPQFQCPQCPYRAKRKHHIASHVTNNHPKDGRNTDYRAMAFIPVDSLPASIMDNTILRRFQCSICLKAFKYRADLNRHKEQRCGQNLRFNCPTCPRSYSRQDALDRHIRLECGKEPQFACVSCSYRATRKFSLKNHVRIKHSK